eukprot:scaffold7760_cov286-Pinguiococcus_pyrenoidosus.AAC.3
MTDLHVLLRRSLSHVPTHGSDHCCRALIIPSLWGMLRIAGCRDLGAAVRFLNARRWAHRLPTF